jgi:hypothetical protein
MDTEAIREKANFTLRLLNRFEIAFHNSLLFLTEHTEPVVCNESEGMVHLTIELTGYERRSEARSRCSGNTLTLSG